VGTVAAPQLLYAAGLLEDLPRTLAEQVRDPLGAQATVLALLLDPRDDVARQRLAWLGRHVHPAVVRQMRTLAPEVRKFAPEERLPLVELAVPALRQMSPAQSREFLAGETALVHADREVSIFEFALQQLLLRHLVTYFVDRGPRPPKYTDVAPLVQPASIVLSALARGGASSPGAANQSFVAGVTALDWPGVRLESSTEGATDLSWLDAALRTLDAASRPLKKQLLLGCAACVGADGRVTVEEGELLRAIADAIDCPMPPLIGDGEPGSPPSDTLAGHGDRG
jgi:hypothetical protein